MRGLLAQEKRRLSKVIGNAPTVRLHDRQRGGPAADPQDADHADELPRNLTGKDVNALDTRLGALMARPQMPKGAIPKNMRPRKGAFRQQRQR